MELGGWKSGLFDIPEGMFTDLMEQAGFHNVHEEWDLVLVKQCLNIVLNHIECLSLLKWERDGMTLVDAEAEIKKLRRDLESQSGGVLV